jgi:hypothetical protein
MSIFKQLFTFLKCAVPLQTLMLISDKEKNVLQHWDQVLMLIHLRRQAAALNEAIDAARY